MNVHLYRVAAYHKTKPLDQTLADIERAPLAKRLRLIGPHEVRVEKIYSPGSRGNKSPYWFIDFTRLRFENGPGKVSRSTPIEGFQLKQSEGFGEETAALYDPKTGYILVQYNHNGVRSGTIKEYFSQFDQNATQVYEMLPKLDDSSERRLAQKQVLKKISFKVDGAHMTNVRKAGVSLERAIELNDHLRGQMIEITVSAGRSSNAMLSHGSVMKLVDYLTNVYQRATDGNPSGVEKLEVTGKTTLDSRAEAIDMLAPKVETTIDGLILGDVDRRYTFDSRAKGLARARSGWDDLVRP